VSTPAPTVTLTALPGEVALGAGVTLAGSLTAGGAPVAGAAVEVEASPYPYKAWVPAGSAVTATDGSYRIGVSGLQVNERVRARALGTSSAPVKVTVNPRAALHATSLGPGRVRISARIAHGAGVFSPPVPVRWYLASRGSDIYHLAATTQSHELPGATTYASAIVNPPARRFRWRVCLNPPWEAAMGPATAHGRCPPHGFRLPAAKARAGAEATAPRARAALEFGGEARGTPLAPFPTAAGIAAARSYLAARAGRTSFAVLDSSGRLSGLNTREHFETASVVKVMFLTAYLQMLEARHRSLGAGDRALLYPMIHESNNQDASAVLAVVGGGAVARVAREAGMHDYAPGVGWWAYTQTSAADQARFFAQLRRLIPSRFYGYARYLMSTIEPEQSWGVPTVARPRWQVYFKTGALPERGLFTEAALLERGPISFTVAVLTDSDPSKAYGEETIAGVAERLLAGSP
jgi:sulfur carrier protein ThiS